MEARPRPMQISIGSAQILSVSVSRYRTVKVDHYNLFCRIFRNKRLVNRRDHHIAVYLWVITHILQNERFLGIRLIFNGEQVYTKI